MTGILSRRDNMRQRVKSNFLNSNICLDTLSICKPTMSISKFHERHNEDGNETQLSLRKSYSVKSSCS